MSLEIIVKRREEILDGIVYEYGGIRRFAKNLNDVAERLTECAFRTLRDKAEEAQDANPISIEIAIRNVKNLRDECERRLKWLNRELEAFRTADSDEPVPTCDEYPLNMEHYDEYRSQLALGQNRLEAVA